MKKIISLLIAITMVCMSMSGCGDSPPSDSVIETATEQTAVTTTAKYTEEELEQMAQNMPEIVFITSHHDYDENIKGYFITNEGKMKMYDFRNIAPDEQYDLLEVMDQLDSALCTEMDIGGIITKEEDLPQISKEKLLEYYKILQKVSKHSRIVTRESYLDVEAGYGHFYGIRYNRKNEREIITLNGWGDFYEENLDKDARKIKKREVFQGLL